MRELVPQPSAKSQIAKFACVSAAPIWNVYSANGGDFGSLGGNYTFAQWQALGIDTNSVVTNPQLQSRLCATEFRSDKCRLAFRRSARFRMYIQKGDLHQ